MKTLIKAGVLAVSLVSISVSAALLSPDGEDVGFSDRLQTVSELSNSGDEFEKAWVEDHLGESVTILFRTEPQHYQELVWDSGTGDPMTLSDVGWEFDENFIPEYFVIKKGTISALYENQLEMSWGVINTRDLNKYSGIYFGEDDNEISHVTGYNVINTPKPVPEPGVIGLLGIGLVGLAVQRRRRKQ